MDKRVALDDGIEEVATDLPLGVSHQREIETPRDIPPLFTRLVKVRSSI